MRPKRWGTFVLVFSAVGTAVFAGAKVGNLGVAFAFRPDPAVPRICDRPDFRLPRQPSRDSRPIRDRANLSRQCGDLRCRASDRRAWVAGVVIYTVANSLPAYNRAADGLGANGWGAHSPSAEKNLLGNVVSDGYGIGAAMIIEILLTALLVFVVLASTDQISDVPLAGVSIGFTLAVIHLISIPIGQHLRQPRSKPRCRTVPGRLHSVRCGCSSCSRSSAVRSVHSSIEHSSDGSTVWTADRHCFHRPGRLQLQLKSARSFAATASNFL